MQGGSYHPSSRNSPQMIEKFKKYQGRNRFVHTLFINKIIYSLYILFVITIYLFFITLKFTANTEI